ncbi:MAG: helix-turn-helix domain-containing protein [Burkholderiales bacterium]
MRSTTFIRGLRRHCSIAPNADGIVWKVDVGSEDVARIVGASREMVSRVLKNLREAGLIGRCGHRIDILNHDGLNKECVRTFPRAAQERPSVVVGQTRNDARCFKGDEPCDIIF